MLAWEMKNEHKQILSVDENGPDSKEWEKSQQLKVKKFGFQMDQS